MSTPTTYWNPGERATLARELGVSRQYLSDVLTGRKNVSVDQAKRLEEVSALVLGKARAIPASAWLGLEKHVALTR